MYILTSSDLPFFVCLPVVYLHVYYCNKFEVWCSYFPPTECKVPCTVQVGAMHCTAYGKPWGS